MGKNNKNIKNNKNLNKSAGNSKRTLTIVIIVIVFSIGVGIVGFTSTSANNNNSKNQNITENWMDIHGIGMFPIGEDDGSLYLATHDGLFKKNKGNNSSGWVGVGSDKSDLMGFTINPNKEGIMYSSGHPQTGGNLGFRISNDYGVTWQKVSDVTAT
nr:hypothetical protein [Nitrosopumilus sp.]